MKSLWSTPNISVLLAVALMFSAHAAQADQAKPGGAVSKTPLLTLDKRQTSTVSIVAVGHERIPLKAVVTFFDENDKRLAVRKGRVARGSGAFVAKLAHDDTTILEPFLVRSEVRLVPTRSTANGVTCPSAISMQNSDGPVLTWVGESCSCGPSQGGHVFVDCVGTGNPIIGQ